ncbi:trehalose-phosphatase [Lysinibacter cavernae]|uniref:Trehalose 6-phosphate phosphatase n=1 Tax=Lysinibacter cavernae TaxID=1640652 RepID=A0A7X5TV18_9MICO|nr:trehalose-phosphatase [Lysinibacter cavernae]NIH55299.1 trehalose 6-phosphate phosphatase [Lysinibacter cavernae]
MTSLETELERFAALPNVLVALDFDGTLSPEVDVPAEARALPEAQQALIRLAAAPGVSVALVSGRALDSLLEVSGAPENVFFVGSHGAEILSPGEDAGLGLSDDEAAVVGVLGGLLRAAIHDVEGVWVEDKPAGFAVHTRLATAADAAIAVERLDAAVAEIDYPLTTRGGKNIIEFAVRDTTKAEGIRYLRAKVDADSVFFAGDDVTDEDAFLVLLPGDISLKVGEGETAANHRVASPVEVAQILHRLADLRTS